jgi:fructokinase
MGERGCAIFDCGEYVEAPGYRVAVADTVGAGDAFAAGLVHAKSQGWPLERCAAFANALAALVASRPGAIPDWTMDEVWAMLPGDASS